MAPTGTTSMKLTTKQLRQIIKEELGTLMESYADRFEARKAAGIDDALMDVLNSIESSGNYQDYVSSYEMATSLGSKEELLEEIIFRMLQTAEESIPRFINETIKGIFNIPPRNRINFWQRQGVKLDKYSQSPVNPRGYWEPMHVTKEQLATYEVRFLAEELRAVFWDEMIDKADELSNAHMYGGKPEATGPLSVPGGKQRYGSLDIFNARWMKVAPRFYKKIKMEIDKQLQDENIKEIDGILYSPAPRN